jgi:menaquinone-dependent protoporphyrinogen oxidase
MKTVLVTYGSKRGGTAGIAASIAASLREQRLVVVCKSVTEVRDLARYDAIVIGGALYAHRWIGAVTRFVRRNQRILRSKPVWLFSSGPLDDSATKRDLPKVPQVAALMTRIGARDHITFGDRLAPGASGFVAGAMAKSHAGDWRDWRRIRAWSHYLAAEIEKAHLIAPSPEHSARWPLATLCLAVAVTAILGAYVVIAIAILVSSFPATATAS